MPTKQIRIPIKASELVEKLAEATGNDKGKILDDALALLSDAIKILDAGMILYYENPQSSERIRIHILGYDKKV